jgi:hypothetical protein
LDLITAAVFVAHLFLVRERADETEASSTAGRSD